MENKILVTIHKYSRKVLNKENSLYEIIWDKNKIYISSEKELIEVYGGICHAFKKVELNNEVKEKIKPETLEALIQLTKVKNKDCEEIERLKEDMKRDYLLRRFRI